MSKDVVRDVNSVLSSIDADQPRPAGSESVIRGFIRDFDRHILHEKNGLLAIDKPPFIAISGLGSFFRFGLWEIVQAVTGEDYHPINRLDRDTSGLVLFGGTRNDRAMVSRLFAKGEVSKGYIAITEQFEPKISGIIAPIIRVEDSPRVAVGIGHEAKHAATAFRQIGEFQHEDRTYSLLSVHLASGGRTHQIRAHLSEIGCPIAGDLVYNPDGQGDFVRQQLHSSSLSFTDTRTNQAVVIKAPLAPDMHARLSQTFVAIGR